MYLFFGVSIVCIDVLSVYAGAADSLKASQVFSKAAFVIFFATGFSTKSPVASVVLSITLFEAVLRTFVANFVLYCQEVLTIFTAQFSN